MKELQAIASIVHNAANEGEAKQLSERLKTELAEVHSFFVN
ncbi:MAG: hypothetical protein ABF649_05815 [Bacillus sp. (in: firmicutes)]